MGARVESEPTWSTEDIFGRVNILQKLPFILEYAGIPESCTVLHPRNIAAEDAGPASRQATYKNILPGRPDIVKQAEQRARSLGGKLDIPRLGWKYSWSRPIFGCKLAKRIQFWLPTTERLA